MVGPEVTEGEHERLLPEMADAVRRNSASFSQLCSVWADPSRAPTDPTPIQPAAAYFYPRILGAFQASHGNISDFLAVPKINAFVARTDAVRGPAVGAAASAAVTARSTKPDMHFLYDLSNVPFGADLLTKIEMMAADSSSLLSGQRLVNCLDQLYSTTTDLLGLQAHDSAGCEKDDRAASDQLVIIRHDLKVIQDKHLISSARMTYFTGTLIGTGMAVTVALAVLLIQAVSSLIGVKFDPGLGLYLAWLFGTAGATLSVVQRLGSGNLDLRYDVGNGYTLLLGLLRPFIGAFGGLLIWVLVLGGVILNSQASPYYMAGLAFAFGIAERRLGDVATQSGILASMSPSTSAPGSMVTGPATQVSTSAPAAHDPAKPVGKSSGPVS